MLNDNHAAIAQKIGVPVEVVKVGVKSLEKPRHIRPKLLTEDLDSIVNDRTIDVILELIGGTDPAHRLVQIALENGKHVVTANKELIAKQGAKLLTLALSKSLDLHFEAAVGGGIPIVQPLKHQLAGNDVIKMMGILNGTSNYILTRMSEDRCSFETALKEAQKKGYAEADPTNDVDGIDTKYKISILSSIVFGAQIPLDEVYCEGIRNISAKDIAQAAQFGYRIKLLGIVDAIEKSKVRVRVHPALVSAQHPLASVNGVYNGVWVQGDFVGDVMFSGRGAGGNPTASAVVGDLIAVGRTMMWDSPASTIPYADTMDVESIEGLESKYYVRVLAKDRPLGLGQIATVFGKHNVSLASLDMHPDRGGDAELVFMTHVSREENVQRTLAELRTDSLVRSVQSCIRVED